MEIKKIDLNTAPTFVPEPAPKILPVTKIAGVVLIILLGLGLGVFAKKNTALSSVLPGGSPVISTAAPVDGLKEGDVVGVNDDATFKDEVKGVLDKGGFNGEGSHKLLRPGGASQTVYLTSSVVDLDEFVGHEVTVKGQTFSGQKVGWLMDVGRVKVEKLNAPLPE
jgi:hypothetical protein